MGIVENLREKAKKHPKKIVLPEGKDDRVICAAAEVAKQKIAHPILLGDPKKIKKIAKEKSIDLTSVEMIRPIEQKNFKEYINLYHELRKARNIKKDHDKLSAKIHYTQDI